MPKPCELEKTSQSKYSPGIIREKENLIRIVISPLHWDPETNRLKPAAIRRSELLQGGASVQRSEYTDKQFIKKRGEELAGRKRENQFVGIVEAVCSSIRAISNSNVQCFSILDTAREKNRGHADIFFSEKFCRPLQLKFREKLLNTFSNLIDNF